MSLPKIKFLCKNFGGKVNNVIYVTLKQTKSRFFCFLNLHFRHCRYSLEKLREELLCLNSPSYLYQENLLIYLQPPKSLRAEAVKMYVTLVFITFLELKII